MNRREFLGSAAAFLAAPAGRPNIVVIVSDDQGMGDVGCYGAKDILTPNLDRLAAEGVRFTDWHANSPVCSPSRAALITGKYPQRAGIPEILFSKPDFAVPGLRKGGKTLASELRAAGYGTAAIGKWHLGSAPGSRPLEQGFDEFFGFYSGWIDYFSHRFYTLGGQPVYHDLWRNEKEVWHEPEYQTELLAREAREFLARQKADRPFFLYLAFGAPHYPMMAPAKYLDRFSASMDRDRRLHAAMVAALDDAVGEVLRALPSDNTIVFFQSDNGATEEVRADHEGRRYRGGSNGIYRGHKGSLFEGGTRVPAILRWPGRAQAGRVSRDLCAGMDLMPTLLKAAGATAPDGLDGRDIFSTAPRRVFWEYTGQTAVRDGNWKLIDRPREALNEPPGQKAMLFNLASDPGERQDLAARHPGRVRELRQAIDEWRARIKS
jgi:arylsulfatase A-like enzyme